MPPWAQGSQALEQPRRVRHVTATGCAVACGRDSRSWPSTKRAGDPRGWAAVRCSFRHSAQLMGMSCRGNARHGGRGCRQGRRHAAIHGEPNAEPNTRQKSAPSGGRLPLDEIANLNPKHA